MSGWRMPAEWEPHAATWLAWPHNTGDWPGKFAPIPWVYCEIVKKLTPGETVRLLVADEAMRRRAEGMLRKAGADLGRVEFHLCPTDRGWTRDTGPMFVTGAGGRRAIVHWRFNAWAKYGNWQRDARIPEYAASALGVERIEPLSSGDRMVLEGGAIDVNGAGTLLTTEECLLSPVQARNPGMSREEVEAMLGRFLGVRKVLWLRNGIAGDDTHGHIDDLARFVDARTVVIATEEDPSDANYRPLQENLELLEQMTDQDGRPLRIVRLPMPDPVVFRGIRLPASYANFYIANQAVLVPTFNDAKDRVALGTLAELFPEREVVGIHATDLVWGLGTIHCMTQQEPE